MLSGYNLRSTTRPPESYSRPSMIRVNPGVQFKSFKNLSAPRPQTTVGSIFNFFASDQDSTPELSEFFFLTNVNGFQGVKKERVKGEYTSRNIPKINLKKNIKAHREFLKSTYQTDAQTARIVHIKEIKEPHKKDTAQVFPDEVFREIYLARSKVNP